VIEVNRGLRSTKTAVAVAVAMATVLALSACGDAPFGPLAELDPEVVAFADQMNAHRQTVGCAPLAWNDDVAAVALAHSQDMIDRGFFSHENPDGESPFDRLHAAGIHYSRAAENIAYGYPTATSVLDAWLNSPGHRSNIENCALTQHGVGRVGTHWTHMFVTP
jgi:uncharacterized protein YkwD